MRTLGKNNLEVSALRLGFVPWNPLGQGFLTVKVDSAQAFDPADVRASFSRFTPEARQANQPLVDLLSQIALAWLLDQKPWIVPIPETAKRERLEEILGAVAVNLSPGDLREIESAASQITVQRARYPESMERLTES